MKFFTFQSMMKLTQINSMIERPLSMMWVATELEGAASGDTGELANY